MSGQFQRLLLEAQDSGRTLSALAHTLKQDASQTTERFDLAFAKVQPAPNILTTPPPLRFSCFPDISRTDLKVSPEGTSGDL